MAISEDTEGVVRSSRQVAAPAAERAGITGAPREERTRGGGERAPARPAAAPARPSDATELMVPSNIILSEN